MTTAVPWVISTDVTHLSKSPISQSSVAHPPHWIWTGRAFEIHSHLIQQRIRTMHWDTSSVPWVPSRADLCLPLHSRTSYGIKQFMWLSSGAGFNLWNLVLFGHQCFGGPSKLTEEKIKSPVDSHLVWTKSSGTIYLLTLPPLQILASSLATSSQIQALSSADTSGNTCNISFQYEKALKLRPSRHARSKGYRLQLSPVESAILLFYYL